MKSAIRLGPVKPERIKEAVDPADLSLVNIAIRQGHRNEEVACFLLLGPCPDAPTLMVEAVPGG